MLLLYALLLACPYTDAALLDDNSMEHHVGKMVHWIILINKKV